MGLTCFVDLWLFTIRKKSQEIWLSNFQDKISTSKTAIPGKMVSNYISHNSDQSSKLNYMDFREKNSVWWAWPRWSPSAVRWVISKMLKGKQHVDLIISTLPFSKWIDSGKPWLSQRRLSQRRPSKRRLSRWKL